MKEFEDFEVAPGPPVDGEAYFLAWGDPANHCRTGTMETGFFWDALHIDTIGLYAHSSLNTPEGYRQIMSYQAPRPAADIVLRGSLPASKYRQPSTDLRWNGIVLALQNPSDRSIHRGSSTTDYYNFVESACRRYGKHLFLKLHPWNSGEIESRFRELASAHGCQIGRVGHEIVLGAKFVLVYNSTFVVDCLMRGIKVAQFAPGYFYQCPGVNYTSRQFPDEVEDKREDGYRLCDFLVWRYCFSQAMSIARIVEVFRTFANSTEMFPLKEELSYAANI